MADGSGVGLQWTAIAAVALWVASRCIDYFNAIRRNKKIRSNLVRSLFAEIEYNTQDLKDFLNQSPNIEIFEEKLIDPEFTPHITDARHTRVYRENISLLHNVKDTLIQKLITFYGDLAKISAQIDGILMPSYKSISVEGQVNVIRILYERCAMCKKQGDDLVKEMKAAYPELELGRDDQRRS